MKTYEAMKKTAQREVQTSTESTLCFFLPAVVPVLLFFASYLTLNWSHFVGMCEPAGDLSLISLHVERAKNFLTNLGPYSRFGFRHPHPFFSYYYAGVEALWTFASTAHSAHRLGQFLLNSFFLGVAGGALALSLPTHRLTAPPLLYFFFFVTAAATEPDFIETTWNPATIAAPFLAFIATSFALSSGRALFVAPMCLSAMVATSNHLGAVPVVLPIFVIALIFGALKRYRGVGHPLSLSELVGGVIALFICLTWLLPIAYEASTTTGWGNIGAVIRYRQQSDEVFGVAGAAKLVSRAMWRPLLSLIPREWDRGLLSFGASTAAFLVVWLIFARHGNALRLLALLTSAFFLAIIAVAQVSTPPSQYMVWFVIAISSTLQALLFSGLFVLLTSQRSQKTIFTLTTLALSVAPLLFFSLREASCGQRRAKLDIFLSDFAGDAIHLTFDELNVWPLATAVALELTRKNIDYCVERRWWYIFGRGTACASPPPQCDFAFHISSSSSSSSSTRRLKLGKGVIHVRECS